MNKNVLELLEISAARFPDKIALKDENNSLTYTDLLTKAKAIGSYLKKYNSQNKPVAVVIDRNLESIVMFMGIVYSGNFYIPISKEFPQKRVETIFGTLNPVAVCCMSADSEFLQEIDSVMPSIYEDMIEEAIDQEYLDTVRQNMQDTDPLYCIFTSGSTGVPKGAMISHRGVLNLTEIFAEEFGFSEDDIFGNQAPFDFDVSTKDIYNAFKHGATVDIIPKQFFFFPVKLIGYLNERKITVAFWAVAALSVVANLRAMKKIQPETLKKVLFSGEMMPVRVLNYWREYLPDTEFVNLYGPTEITCNCTFYKIERQFELTEILPMGKPFQNMTVFLLNEEDQLCKKGETGEVCVGGGNIGLGYYNNPEKTAEVFVQNPLNQSYFDRIYRTGDLAYQAEDGNFVFVSRKDFQIKHMGHRIELQEIEAAVSSLEMIHACCCLYKKSAGKIILFYSTEKECNETIMEELDELLPKYMLPNQYVYLEKLPLSLHGKIDRQALKEMIDHGRI